MRGYVVAMAALEAPKPKDTMSQMSGPEQMMKPEL